MKSTENKILFKEIKSYEEAYFYNSSPEDRNNKSLNGADNYKKKDSKMKRFFESAAGEMFEGVIEILFSILD
ncbi:hypothetical protein [Clostridium sp.]|uniref:hypothetical protein n=1 Tax=Clostridium sp. TaxID=1506 RepID=UPI0025BFDF17|nr:hypothetical protein [Clostridium sp.]